MHKIIRPEETSQIAVVTGSKQKKKKKKKMGKPEEYKT
jgi:hypothetical protein